MIAHWNSDKSVAIMDLNGNWQSSYSQSNNTISVDFNLELSIREGHYYSYHYAIEIVYKNRVVWWGYIKDNNDAGTGTTYSLRTTSSITFNASGGDGWLKIRGVCCGSGSGTYGCSCNWNQQYTDDIDENKRYIPTFYSDPSLDASRLGGSLGRYNYSDLGVKWTAWGDRSINPCTIKIYRSATEHGSKTLIKTVSNGNNSGSFYWKPSDYGIGSHETYWIHVVRTHDILGSSSSSWFAENTYTNPSVSSVSVSQDPIDADWNLGIIGVTTPERWTEELITSTVYINGQVAEILSNVSSFTHYYKCIDYISNPSSTNRITIKVEDKNNSSGVTSSKSTTVTVRYAPTSQVSSVVFKKNNSSGSVISAGATVEKDTVIYVSWDYVDTSTNGIAKGYKVEIIDSNGNVKKSATTSNKYITITADSNNMYMCKMNRIKITPYYTTSIMGTNSYVSNLVLPMSQLNAPTINYPVSNGIWGSKKFRLLVTLPTDPDYSSMSTADKSAYRYKDVILVIKGTTNKTISFRNNPSAFSCQYLTYNSKIVINPSAISGMPDPQYQMYTIEIKAIKNYGDETSSAAIGQVATKGIGVSGREYNIPDEYDRIYRSYYNRPSDNKIVLGPDNLSMNCETYYNCYGFSESGYITNFDGKIITRQFFINQISKMQACADRINGFPTDGFYRSAVKVTRPSNLTSSSYEIIDNSGNRNYFKQVQDRIDTLMNS